MSKLIGYGQSPKGMVIHAIVEGNTALCDKRQVGLVVNKKATADNVTCAKCSKHSLVKSIATGKKDFGLMSGLPVAKAKPKPKPKPKPTPAKAPPKKVEPKKVEDYDFVSQQKGSTFNIYHRPSKKAFFEGIPVKVIDIAVSKMNDMEIRWTDINHAVPKNFLSGCRTALREAYEEANLEPPRFTLEVEAEKPKKKAKKKVTPKQKTEKFKKGDELNLNGVLHVYNGKKWVKKKVQKPKRVIKRRAGKAEKPKRTIKRRKKKVETKKPKRVIKRREKRELSEFELLLQSFGMSPNCGPATIVEHLENDGATFGQIAQALVDNYKITEKRAKGKIKRIVRKLARVYHQEIIVTMGESEDDDHYRLNRVQP